MINQFELKTIILVRNIYDIIPSLRDHLIKEGPNTPVSFISSDILKLPEDEFHIAIALVIPWYINFYVGWQYASVDRILITYEQLKNNPENTVEIFIHCGCRISKEEIKNCLSEAGKSRTRMNKVIEVGRGNLIPEAAKAQVEKLCSYYPEIGFQTYRCRVTILLFGSNFQEDPNAIILG